MSESYRNISAKLRGIAKNVIFVDAPFGSRDPEVTIPWSLIHGADAMKIHKGFIGQEVTFRIMDWKAEALGFA